MVSIQTKECTFDILITLTKGLKYNYFPSFFHYNLPKFLSKFLAVNSLQAIGF